MTGFLVSRLKKVHEFLVIIGFEILIFITHDNKFSFHAFFFFFFFFALNVVFCRCDLNRDLNYVEVCQTNLTKGVNIDQYLLIYR